MRDKRREVKERKIVPMKTKWGYKTYKSQSLL